MWLLTTPVEGGHHKEILRCNEVSSSHKLRRVPAQDHCMLQSDCVGNFQKTNYTLVALDLKQQDLWSTVSGLRDLDLVPHSLVWRSTVWGSTVWGSTVLWVRDLENILLNQSLVSHSLRLATRTNKPLVSHSLPSSSLAGELAIVPPFHFHCEPDGAIFPLRMKWYIWRLLVFVPTMIAVSNHSYEPTTKKEVLSTYAYALQQLS